MESRVAEHKICLITGASRGLGFHLAAAFWRAGYSLFLVARNNVELNHLLAMLPPMGAQRARAFVADLSDPAASKRITETVCSEFSRIDVLINNAATQGPLGPLWSTTADDWARAIQVNLLSPIDLCRGLLPLMIDQRSGSIVNLSGGGATGPRPNFSAYATAKAGLVRFSETIAEEVKQFGIKVNAIAPGAMKTAMLSEVLADGAEKAGDREYSIAETVFATGGTSMDDVARLALFLGGDASLGITGKLISAVWDNWEKWPEHREELAASDAYTLRRIGGRDRGFGWGDK